MDSLWLMAANGSFEGDKEMSVTAIIKLCISNVPW